MRISATVTNSETSHLAQVEAGGVLRHVAIPAKEASRGSSVSGGELLILALATCYCNDIFREAATRGIAVRSVTVTARGNFESAGMPASDIDYHAAVEADASEEQIQELIEHTDSVAEVHLTIRRGLEVRLLPSPETKDE